MFSRAGTALVAMMLRERSVPVVCCCETYKFSERVMLDSIVGNERGEAFALLSESTARVSAVGPHPLLAVASELRRALVLIASSLAATPAPLVPSAMATAPTASTAAPTSSASKSAPPPTAAPSTTTTGPSAALPPNLSPLSLLYDVSRPEDVTVVITEAGLIPVQSVPVLLRDYKPVQGRNS